MKPLFSNFYVFILFIFFLFRSRDFDRLSLCIDYYYCDKIKYSKMILRLCEYWFQFANFFSRFSKKKINFFLDGYFEVWNALKIYTYFTDFDDFMIR